MSWGVATQNGVSVSLASIVSLSAGVTEFSPADLFTGGVAGAWYDPSDYSTLFQDSAGTTPVTAVEQPVGLILDKSQGLAGTQQINDPSFDSGIAGWGAQFPGADVTFAWNSTLKSMTVTRTGAGITGRPTYPISVVAGTWYKITFITNAAGVTNSAAFSVSDAVGGTAISGLGPQGVSTQTTVKYGVATTTGTVYVGLWCNTSSSVDILSVEITAVAGNHASQATAASRPVLRARYNLLTYSEQFDNAVWAKTNVTLTANAIAAPDGTLTADNAAISAATAVTSVNSNAGVAVSVGTFTVSCYVKANGVQYANVGFVYSAGIYSATQFDLTNGTVVRTFSATYTSPSATITPLSNGWYRCTHTATVTTTTIFPFVSPSNALWTAGEPRQSLTGNGTDGIYIWGADLRTGSSAGTYQRIAAATDYATAGFLPYLAFDGTDDFVASSAINFSTTDKMTLCTGITKNSDALRGVFAHLGNTATATFRAEAPDASLNTFAFYTTGSAVIQGAGAAVAAPATRVFTGIADIAADTNLLRLNGTQVASNTADQGTGNYSNAAVNVGRRGDNSLFFNGRIYQMVVCGKTLSAAELASTEAYVATKTGVTL